MQETYISVRPSKYGGYTVQERDASGKLIEDGNNGPYPLKQALTVAKQIANGRKIVSEMLPWDSIEWV